MTRRARIAYALAASCLLALVLTGCSQGNPPCEQLPAPTEAEQTATREGAEVEREVTSKGFGGGEAECVVVGDRWVDQTDEQ